VKYVLSWFDFQITLILNSSPGKAFRELLASIGCGKQHTLASEQKIQENDAKTQRPPDSALPVSQRPFEARELVHLTT
jgi:hypothetical protein